MIWLLKLLFPNWNTTVRIKSGHLPGLKAPTITPKVPHPRRDETSPATNIQNLYARYKEANPNKQPRKNDAKDFGF
jgi:hypothetical protein